MAPRSIPNNFIPIGRYRIGDDVEIVQAFPRVGKADDEAMWFVCTEDRATGCETLPAALRHAANEIEK